MHKILIFVIASLIFSLFLVAFLRPISSINYDLGRHLLLGNIIVQTHTVPEINLLSYAYENYPFINSHWLSEAVFAIIHKCCSLNFLLLFSTLIVAIACLIQVLFVYKKSSAVSILLSSALYLFLISSRSDLRPELFSMLFLSIFIAILYSFRKAQSKYIFFLIPIEILWVNMHIYFFVGPLLIFIFLLDHLFTNKLKLSKSVKIFGITLIGALTATLINPNGLKGAIFPFTVLGSYGLPIIENQSMFSLNYFFFDFAILAFLSSVFFLFALLFLERKRTRPIDWFLSTAFSLAALLIYRNILLFAFTTFIPFTLCLNFFIKDALLFFKKLLPKKHLGVLTNLCLVCLMLILATAIVRNVSVKGFGFGNTDYGEKTGDFLIKNKIKGPIFNTFDIGGYLASRVYPNLVYTDGRPEAYPKSFFENIYGPMQENPQIFERENRKYKFNVLVLSHWDQTPWPNPLLEYLLSHRLFSLVHIDSYSIVLLRNAKENSNLITKDKTVKDDIEFNNIDSPLQLIRYLFFFEKVNWTDKTQEAFTRLKEIDPQLCLLKRHFASLRYHKVSFINEKELESTCQFPIF